MIYLSCHARICAFNITGLFMVHWYELPVHPAVQRSRFSAQASAAGARHMVHLPLC